jgi:hypothetical protein
MRKLPWYAMLLAACLAFAGCKQEVTRQQVAEFVDQADEAARKRFAPEICALRGRNFELHVTFHGHDADEPSELDMTRKLFCREAGSFARLRQYRLERKSIDIQLAKDRRTATVTAEYVETMPYYEPDRIPVTPDDFREFQVVETLDDSRVGIEDGELVFLGTDSEAHQSLVPKKSVDIPYD